ncbi:MAG: Cys-tRNA(Pro) deacylase [Clostridia bacterium]|nr:Cys-tRNA(Pro) deacylase [Clostridia bacterium]
MGKNNTNKTNVMRILDRKKATYTAHEYESTGAISGTEVAATLGQDERQVFKTLVTTGHSKQHYVFMVPVTGGLDLKKAAKAAGEKSIEMIKEKELLPLTGYVHGGCSPVGMKKFFPTFIDRTAADFDTIMFSAGRIGYQIQTSTDELAKVIEFTLADVRTEE